MIHLRECETSARADSRRRSCIFDAFSSVCGLRPANNFPPSTALGLAPAPRGKKKGRWGQGGGGSATTMGEARQPCSRAKFFRGAGRAIICPTHRQQIQYRRRVARTHGFPSLSLSLSASLALTYARDIRDVHRRRAMQRQQPRRRNRTHTIACSPWLRPCVWIHVIVSLSLCLSRSTARSTLLLALLPALGTLEMQSSLDDGDVNFDRRARRMFYYCR